MTGGLVHLLDADPDLAADLPASARPLARASLVAAVETLPAGACAPADDGEHYGALILGGLLLRQMTVAGRPSGELLGAGDVLLPLGRDQVSFVARTMAWQALSPVRLAWLGSAVLAGAVRWPAIGRTLAERAERRVARLLAMQSLAHLSRVEDRLLGVLWLLAERWGRVTAEGVVVAVPLTHRALGQLVGAQRPSVTSGLGALEEAGLLHRREDGDWVLEGDPPDFVQSADGGRQDGRPAPGAVG